MTRHRPTTPGSPDVRAYIELFFVVLGMSVMLIGLMAAYQNGWVTDLLAHLAGASPTPSVSP